MICAVGENLRTDPTLFGRAVTSLERIPLRLVSQAGSRRNITFVLRDADVPHAMMRLHETFFRDEASARRPRQDGTARRRAGAAVRLRGRRRDRSAFAAPRRRAGRPTWAGVDVAIDFSTPDSVSANAPALAGRGINLVIGTTGWSRHEAVLRRTVADAGVGIVAAPNFSTGVVLFEAIVARRGEAVRAAGRVRRVPSRSASLRPRRTRRPARRCC